MNIFAITLKQMRQRYLTGWLTVFSVALGVALAVAILLCRREGQAIFGQTQYGFEVLVGPKGSPTQLVINTLYHIDKSPGNMAYSFYEELAHSAAYRPYVRHAIPYAVGDSYLGHRIVGTLPQLFGRADDGITAEGQPWDVRPGQPYYFAEGRCFNAHKFEAVIGSELAQKGLLTIGSTFHATHGVPLPNEVQDIHPEIWTVVGILGTTHTANDRVLFIPLESFYGISEHEEGMQQIFQTQQKLSSTTQPRPQPQAQESSEKPYTLNADGTFNLTLPKEEWLVSAVLVKTRGPSQMLALMSAINNGKEGIAVNPASVMEEFFSTFLAGSATVLLVISVLVTVITCIGVLVSIYTSVIFRQREIAIFRALGATRRRVLAIICLEAGITGLLGGVAGVILGHLLTAVGSFYLLQHIGQSINWITISSDEIYYLLFVIILATLAGLVPALKAYRTPVAENLTTV